MGKHRKKEFFRKLHHKKWVRNTLSALMVVFLPFVGFYMHFIEPKLVKISKLKIPIKNLPRDLHHFRVVQISDLHFGPTNDSASFLKRCIERINDLKPDLIALTGDFLQWDKKYLKSLANILSNLAAERGVFAILGNHDYGVCHPGHPAVDDIDHEEVMCEFGKKGIKVLHNENIPIRKGDGRMNVVGIGDFWTEHFLPHKAFTNAGVNMPTLLLCHNPDSIEHLDGFSFDLMLSGHVHGGQISFPFYGPLVVPVKNRKWRRGLHRVKDRWLYANRGLGHIFKARLLSQPEITCLDLVLEASHTPSA